MKLALKMFLCLLLAPLMVLAVGASWYIYTKQPKRSGELMLARLNVPVTVRYDELGVPHIKVGQALKSPSPSNENPPGFCKETELRI